MNNKPFDVRLLSDRPNLYVIDDFLSAQECAILIRMAKNRGMQKQAFSFDYSNPQSKIAGDVSAYTRFKNDENKTLLTINTRMGLLTKFPLDYGGQMMIISYGLGGDFYSHFDFSKVKPLGDRIAQMLLYLNDVEEGGETTFAKIGIKIIPKRGRALLWYNVENMCIPNDSDTHPIIPAELNNNPYSLHKGNPVIRGEKWIASKTFHAVSINGQAD